MRRVLFLDSGPLGMVTHPRGDARTRACADWFLAALGEGREFVLPEICDYEVRRELIRSGRSVERLDQLGALITPVPISTQAMRRAAQLWAAMRNAGVSTADKHALDGDVILAAQAEVFAHANGPCEVLVVTENVGHLQRLCAAARWDEIPSQ